MRVVSVPGTPTFKGEVGAEEEEPSVKAEKEAAPVESEQRP